MSFLQILVLHAFTNSFDHPGSFTAEYGWEIDQGQRTRCQHDVLASESVCENQGWPQDHETRPCSHDPLLRSSPRPLNLLRKPYYIFRLSATSAPTPSNPSPNTTPLTPPHCLYLLSCRSSPLFQPFWLFPSLLRHLPPAPLRAIIKDWTHRMTNPAILHLNQYLIISDFVQYYTRHLESIAGLVRH